MMSCVFVMCCVCHRVVVFIMICLDVHKLLIVSSYVFVCDFVWAGGGYGRGSSYVLPRVCLVMCFKYGCDW